jgi:hypothetical protein
MADKDKPIIRGERANKEISKTTELRDNARRQQSTRVTSEQAPPPRPNKPKK